MLFVMTLIHRLFLDFWTLAPPSRGALAVDCMMQVRKTFLGIAGAAFLLSTLSGCFVHESDRFADWSEYRIKRAGDENGVLIAKVKRRGDKEKWPGDSYNVLVRWPTNIDFLPRDVSEAERKKEGQAFIQTLCGENQQPYVISESFNQRTGDVFYNLWCRPPSKG